MSFSMRSSDRRDNTHSDETHIIKLQDDTDSDETHMIKLQDDTGLNHKITDWYSLKPQNVVYICHIDGIIIYKVLCKNKCALLCALFCALQGTYFVVPSLI